MRLLYCINCSHCSSQWRLFCSGCAFVSYAVRDRGDRQSSLLNVHHFCRDLDMDFEIPFRELGFSGVPHRSTAFIMPTVCPTACAA